MVSQFRGNLKIYSISSLIVNYTGVIIGAKLWDKNGKEYLDFIGGQGSVSAGHCHPKLIGAMQEQMCVLHQTTRSINNTVLPEFCQTLCTLFNYDKVVVTNTGWFWWISWLSQRLYREPIRKHCNFPHRKRSCGVSCEIGPNLGLQREENLSQRRNCGVHQRKLLGMFSGCDILFNRPSFVQWVQAFVKWDETDSLRRSMFAWGEIRSHFSAFPVTYIR